MNELNNKNKGFSLVELIVVIAIMAVMVAVLAPSLLQYVERSRAQKDDSAMGEVANAIMLGLSDQKIYDEVLYSTATGNVSCYIDSETEATKISDGLLQLTKDVDGDGERDEGDQYWFLDDARLADEVEYHFAGAMRGMTITFSPETGGGNNASVFDMGHGKVNAGLATGAPAAADRVSGTIKYYGGNEWINADLNTLTAGATNDNHNYLYNRLRATVGDQITLTSQTYRKSSYTVFIRMGSTGGNSAAGQDSVKVYGQWNGTNLN